MTDYTILKNCLCCDSNNLVTILDLGNQPLANSYLETKTSQETYYPLKLNYCRDCTHLQLTHAVDPDLLFKHYVYVSGTTQTLRDYFTQFAEKTTSLFNKKLKVLDIACNDGSQLDSYKKLGHHTYGIDPATNLFHISSKNHTVTCDYLTKDSISGFGVKFDIIVAQNVFAHNTYPKQFLNLCKDHLAAGGKLFIQTSQADMVKYNQFDTVYHEHISFFNVRSMVKLLNNVGLYLENVEKPSIHGTSYVFTITGDRALDNSTTLVASEIYQSEELLKQFAKNAETTVKELNTKIAEYLNKDYLIVGYGAAAKGNTVLNYGSTVLDYIVDDNPLKQGLYSPGQRIKIVPFDFVKSVKQPIFWIPLSWNFFKEIKQNIESKRTNPQDVFYLLNFTKL